MIEGKNYFASVNTCFTRPKGTMDVIHKSMVFMNCGSACVQIFEEISAREEFSKRMRSAGNTKYEDIIKLEIASRMATLRQMGIDTRGRDSTTQGKPENPISPYTKLPQ